MTLRLDEPFRWGGTVKPASALIPHDGMATVAKAATGWQPYFSGDRPMLSSINRSPQKTMREAQALYHSNPWVGAAERAVTRKVAGLPWHVEDADQEEVDDETPNPALKAVRDLLEKPQAALPFGDRQPGLNTGRGMREIISRHMGLCGVSYVYPDQIDTNGLPLALLYVNPARVDPKVNASGNLLGYMLDGDDYGNGGTPYRADELIPFYLQVPDYGYRVHGLPEAAALKARITSLVDMHTSSSLLRAGRRSGLISPKGYIDDQDQYDQLVMDFREREDRPEPRITVLRGPADFVETDANLNEMGLGDISKLNRDDVFAVWGVPPSQAGIGHQSGLNAGTQGDSEYEVLMTGPVHDRVVVIQETFQYELLDRWIVTGLNPQLVIEEPEFDDDAAPYELAAKAREQPLTNNDRRAILGLDPLPDYGPDGEPLGLAILLPSTLTTWAQGPEANGEFGNAPAPKPEPVIRVLPPEQIPATTGAQSPQLAPPTTPPPAKAAPPRREFLGLRKSIETRMVPAVNKSIAALLAKQRADVVSRLRNATPRQLKDPSFWWSPTWDKKLSAVLQPHAAGIAETVAERARHILTPSKADPFTEAVQNFIQGLTGKRIGGINDTTRDAVGDVIRAGLDEGLTSSEIADRIEGLGAFDESRAELIGRTETMFAYNSAAISSYQEYGVERVEAIDGDEDEACAERHGQVYTLDEAMTIEDHPNGTLDWVPVFAKADPMETFAKAMLTLAEREQVVPVVNVNTPEVIVYPAQVSSPVQVDVHIPEAKPVRKVIERDAEGRITGSTEEPA